MLSALVGPGGDVRGLRRVSIYVREETASTVANVVLAAAAIGAAVVVLRTPALRRLAFGLARTAITTTIPLWLTREIKHAWEESEVPRQPALPVERSA